VSGTTSTSDTTITASITRLTEDATQATTFYVDKCYLQYGLGSLSHPTAWASHYRVGPHHDGSTYNYYIDVTDIPGDVESLSHITAYRQDDTVDQYNFDIYIANSFTNATNMRVSELETWSASGGSPVINDPDSNASNSKSITLSDSAYLEKKYALNENGEKFKVLLAYKITDESTTWIARFDSYALYEAYNQGENVTLSGASTSYYRIADLGIFQGPRLNSQIDYNEHIYMFLYLTLSSGTGDITVDCIYFIPLSDWLVYVDGGSWDLPIGLNVQNEYKSLPQSYLAQHGDGYSYSAKSIGKLGGFMPGYHNRLVTLWLSEHQTRALEFTYWDMVIKYIPRTSFLLGTE